ncbi:thiamine phosphate synthase, partial [Mammaliicoccus vitulinus]
MFDINTLKVYFIAGSQDLPNGDLYKVVEQALIGGITMFQFREKGKN